MSEEIKSPLKTYASLQLLSSVGRGLWQGPYIWFLFEHLGLNAAQLAIIFGCQFIIQILLEIHSGVWAEQNKARMIKVSFALFFCFCLTYFIVGMAAYKAPSADNVWLVIAGAGLAELFFGIAYACQSGSFEEWIVEYQRGLRNSTKESFERDLGRITSIKESWGTGIAGSVGLISFIVATQGEWFAIIPWAGASVIYLVTLLIAFRGVSNSSCHSQKLGVCDGGEPTPKSELHEAGSKSILKPFDQFAHRAIAFLKERQGLRNMIVAGALCYSLFFITQGFWVIFLGECLNITSVEGIQFFDGAPTVALLALIWASGFVARAIGGAEWNLRISSVKQSPVKNPRRTIVVPLSAFALGVILLLLSVLNEALPTLPLFMLGFIICQVSEGRLRRQLGVLTHAEIVSERATLRSIESLIRSLFGLIVVAIVGVLMRNDPFSGYVFLCVLSLIALVIIWILFRQQPLKRHPQLLAARGLPGWMKPLLGGAIVLLVVFNLLKKEPGKLWSNYSGRGSFTAEVIAEGQVESESIENRKKFPVQTWRVVMNLSSGEQVAEEIEATLILPVRPSNVTGLQVESEGAVEPDRKLIFDRKRKKAWLEVTLKNNEAVIISVAAGDTTPFRGHLKGKRREVIPVVHLNSISEDRESNILLFIQLLSGFGAFMYCLYRSQLIADLAFEHGGKIATIVKVIDAPLHSSYDTSGAEVDLRDSPEGLQEIAAFLDVRHILVGAVELVVDEGEREKSREPWCHVYSSFDGETKQGAESPYGMRERRDIAELMANHLVQSRKRWDRPEPDSGGQVDPNSFSVGTGGDILSYRARVPTLKIRGFERRSVYLGVRTAFVKEAERAGGAKSLTLGFACAVYERDEAPRYINRVEQRLLETLAGVSLTLDRKVSFNRMAQTFIHDLGRFGANVKRTTRLIRSEECSINDGLDRLAFHGETIHGLKEDHLGREPSDRLVSLREQVENLVTKIFHGSGTFWDGGTLSLVLNWEPNNDSGWDFQIASRIWYRLFRVLDNVLGNIRTHGCTREQPDAKGKVIVRRHEDHIEFVVSNWAPAKPVNRKPGRQQEDGRFGIISSRTIVQEAGGEWPDELRWNPNKQEVELAFTIPRNYLENKEAREDNESN